MVVAKGFSVTVVGHDPMFRSIKDLPARSFRVWRREAHKHALQVVRKAKADVPVDTGHLKSQIFVIESTTGINEFAVVADTEYAGYVEYGTSKMAPQPYLRPAIEAYANELKSDFVRELEEEVRRGIA